MNGPLGSNVWVFHSGALGDHVMVWPLLRSLARQGTEVTLVAASSQARLAEREIGRQIAGAPGRVRGLGSEQTRFARLWRGEGSGPEAPERGVDTVVSFVADETTQAGRTWCRAAREMFPVAAVICVAAPGSEGRGLLWARSNVRDWGKVAATGRGDGAITLFAGSGGASKRWPLPRWAELAAACGNTRAVRLVAGPVEAEKWTSLELDEFARSGGEVIGAEGDLASLCEVVRSSSVFVGADSGPTHLAAQLGVPTVALFGPTDPGVWAPVGPRVRVIAPEAPGGMEWLTVDRVLEELRASGMFT